jgi:O-antigen/teichoic acid export membrane protein
LPAGLGLVVVSPILLRMLTGQEFVAGPMVLLPIVVAVIFAGLYQINLYSIHLVRRTERLLWVLFVAAAISLGMSALLVPWLGLSGAAIATAAAFAVLATVILVWSRKEIQLRLDYAFVTKCLLAALLMAGLLTLVPASGLQGLIIQTILGIAIYLVLILVMRVFSATEVQTFRQLLPALRARMSL